MPIAYRRLRTRPRHPRTRPGARTRPARHGQGEVREAGFSSVEHLRFRGNLVKRQGATIRGAVEQNGVATRAEAIRPLVEIGLKANIIWG